MVQIALGERHEEADALDPLEVDREGLHLLVVKEVHIPRADLREVIDALDGHRLCLDEFSVFKIAALGADLADIDLRIEVGGKGEAVAARVAVQNIQVVDLVKVVLLSIGGKDACHAGIKAAAKQRRNAGLLKLFTIGPLPLVLELGHILGLIVGGVHVVDARLQARIHDWQILIRQRQIQDDIRLVVLD